MSPYPFFHSTSSHFICLHFIYSGRKYNYTLTELIVIQDTLWSAGSSVLGFIYPFYDFILKNFNPLFLYAFLWYIFCFCYFSNLTLSYWSCVFCEPWLFPSHSNWLEVSEALSWWDKIIYEGFAHSCFASSMWMKQSIWRRRVFSGRHIYTYIIYRERN